jgi:signal peptidase I
MRTRRRLRIPSLVLTVAFVAAWFLLLAPPSLGGHTSYISVSGKSMEPTYVTGDLVIVRKHSSYRPGDIVAFKAQGGIVIHRIVEGDGRSGYVTQGDNNSWRDPWNPTDREVVGTAWFRLPGASRWLLVLTQPIVLAIVVTAMIAWSVLPSRTRPVRPPQLAHPSRRTMPFDDFRRALTAVPRRTIVLAVVAIAAAAALAVPTALAWLDDAERTSFREDARFGETADFAYTFRLDPTTLYPDGTVGPIDASSPPPPKVFAKPARTLDVAIDYRFTGAQADATGRYTVDALVIGDAGWQTTVPLVEPTVFSGATAQVHVPLDLAAIVALGKRVDAESGTTSRGFQVQVRPTFELSTLVAGTEVRESFAPPLTVAHDGATWAVKSELHAEKTQRLGADQTERVELAGVPVTQVRWLWAPALALLLLAVGLVARAVRRDPLLAVDALMRRPGISVIDLEQPPADAALAVPLASAEGIRRVAQRDGGLVLRYDEGGHVRLYARHDERVYSYTPGA